VNNIAKLAKSLDPHHPTMTTVAELGGRRVAAIHSLCPEIDIVGINSYGGAASIPKRYREAGGKKPYLVTEFGPPGSWEVPKNEFGVVVEPTSTRKAEYYRTAYSALESDRELCLGSYAFTWGSKREATATWFGMLLPDGSRLEAVKALQQLWSGKPPTNACPKIASLRLDGPAVVKPQAAVRAKLQVSDPDGDPLRVEWRLERDYEGPSVGGDFQAEMPSFPKAVLNSDASGAELKMPIGGGPYRLYAFVRDDQGNAAAANLPLLVDGPKMLAPSPKAELPLVVYGEAAEPSPYVPSGWMGDTGSISLEPDCAEQPQGGKTCLRCGFSKTDGWGGVVWLSPDGDWGDQPGCFDLTGARQLSFWARGADGGERVTFSFGIIDRDKPYYDSAKGEIGPVELTREWKQFRIGLDLKELHRIKTGFCWVVAGQGKPLTFYLDNIRFE
jgi:hypothetical protein